MRTRDRKLRPHQQRWAACPNQDVTYGAGIAALDQAPVVVKVPDFGDRFWVYQIADLRTDSSAQIGTMYGSKPGHYLLVGPNWKGDVPKRHNAGISCEDEYRLRRAACILGRHCRRPFFDPAALPVQRRDERT
ncbi:MULTISPECIES: DUF1254 domain-containing protein [Agrobacterium]|uniref:DUF1254 domain-containing protein n=1 Tax=Agrobacterium TaxID=357 RepID=UPI00358F864A